MKMHLHGTIVENWTGGVVRSPAILDTRTGELAVDRTRAENMGKRLVERFHTYHDMDVFEVCPYCRGFVTKTVMVPREPGKMLVEAQQCRDPECGSHNL